MKEKVNAGSDYVFLLASVYIFWKSYYRYRVLNMRPQNLFSLMPGLPYIYALINLFHAAGTFANHSCRCSFGHKWDSIGMYSITNFWLPYYVLRYFYYRSFNTYLLRPSERYRSRMCVRYGLMFISLSILTAPFAGVAYSNPYSETIEFAIVAVSCVVCMLLDCLARRMCRARDIVLHFIGGDWYPCAGTSAMIVGVVLHKLDSHGIVCAPDSIFQLHSVWHVLSAVTIVMAFEHAYSENPKYLDLPLVTRLPDVKVR